MNIFAIDLGNKWVKMKSNRKELVYPASYLHSDDVITGGLGSQAVSGNHTFVLENDGGNQFVWGSHLDAYYLSEDMISTYARLGRLEQKKTQRILKFALGRLALDYEEAQNEPLTIRLVLGLPITATHEGSQTVQKLKNLLVGEHKINVDGKILILRIPSEDYISILPQYMGTAFELAFDEKMQARSEYLNGRIGVFDIGGGTVLINTLNQMTPSRNGEERFEGVQSVIKKIAQQINSTKLTTIEHLLREGNTTGQYIYRPNLNQENAKDITAVVNRQIENYTRFTIAPLLTENFPDLEIVDFIIMTGGGSSLLNRAALQDEIGEAYFKRLIFIMESEFANVRGLFKSAFLTWNQALNASLRESAPALTASAIQQADSVAPIEPIPSPVVPPVSYNVEVAPTEAVATPSVEPESMVESESMVDPEPTVDLQAEQLKKVQDQLQALKKEIEEEF